MILQDISEYSNIGTFFLLCLRLIISAGCGAAIGYERKKNYKVAGLRTHVLVCCGAALFMIISKYGFVDMIDANGLYYAGIGEADPSRIAAQVISGIGFLGAGVIFKNGVTIKGLTTAAGLWMTAGVGMAVGSGMILLGVFITLLVVLMQLSMHKKTVGVDSFYTTKIRMVVSTRENAKDIITEFSQFTKALLSTCNIEKNAKDGTLVYTFSVKVPSEITQQQISGFMLEHEEITGIDIIT